MNTITVTLYDKKQTGTDPLGAPIYEDTPSEISGVLVAPVSSEDALQDTNLYGITTVYELAIPKGDSHDWKHKKVSFFGSDWWTVGEPIEGIEENIPLRWNRKVKVTHYE